MYNIILCNFGFLHIYVCKDVDFSGCVFWAFQKSVLFFPTVWVEVETISSLGGS